MRPQTTKAEETLATTTRRLIPDIRSMTALTITNNLVSFLPISPSIIL